MDRPRGFTPFCYLKVSFEADETRKNMIKKSLFLIALALCVALYGNAASQTVTTKVNGVSYYLESGVGTRTARVDQWNESAVEAVIPETVTYNSVDYTVTSIRAGAFSQCNNLISITVPETFAKIGYSAFGDAKSVVEINLPKTITTIESYAFKGCENLEKIDIPVGVTTIGSYAFRDCKRLNNVVLPDGLSYVPSYCFANCESLTSINIPSTVTEFFYECFANTGFTSFVIPEQINSMGIGVFSDCKKLVTVTIPESITSVQSSTFKNCSALTEFKTSGKLNTIFNSAFSGCASLTEINDPANYIYPNAFEDCVSLKTATVSNAAKEMFKGCTSLETVTICDIEIGESMFSGCKNLKSVSLLGRSFSTGTWQIGAFAFSGCESLTSAPLNRVVFIGESAFEGCKSLTDVIIPTSVRSIKKNAFDFSIVKKIVINPVLGNQAISNADGYYFLSSEDYGQKVYAHKIDQPYIENYWKGNVNYFEDTDISSSSVMLCGVNVVFNADSENISYPIRSVAYGKVNQTDAFNAVSSTGDNNYSITNLQPDELYYVYVNDQNGVNVYAFKTVAPVVTFKSLNKRTQTSLGGIVIASFDESCTPKCYILNQECENGEQFYASGLKPGTSYYMDGCADYNGKKFWSETSSNVATLGMDVGIKVTASPTKLIFDGSYADGDANVEKFGFTSTATKSDFDGNMSKIIKGLEPGQTYTAYFGVKVAENSSPYRVAQSGTTVDVTWTEGDFVATSIKSVRLRVATNCDDETGTGIEWRRNDAPDNVSSTYVACPVVDGILVGSLRNLNPEVYYKFRPVYETSSGTKYYGKWTGFYSGDASVYFDPEVRTLKDIEIFENSALVGCFIVPGSDDVKRQGIQYWSKGAIGSRADDGKLEIVTSGLKSIVTLPDLTPGTEYVYRAFAVTDGGTIYGEDMSFITKGTSGVEYVTETLSAELSVKMEENPAREYIRFAVEGAADNKVEVMLVSISGGVVFRDVLDISAGLLGIPADFVSGIYVLVVSDGYNRVSERVIVKK